MRTVHGISLSLVFTCAGCQVKPYAPPPQHVRVESVEIEMGDFHGRPEAYAIVKGRLTSNAAQLIPAKQSREGNQLYLEVLEQTPRGASLLPDLADSPPFEKRFALELLGLPPGNYTLSANGVAVPVTIPSLHAESIPSDSLAAYNSSLSSLPDELVPIEETPYGALTNGTPPSP